MTRIIGPDTIVTDDRVVRLDFDRASFLVIWEVTRACALACVHCRADAIARRDPRELSTDEGFALIDQVLSFGRPYPLLVLTGGDPMWRKDLRRPRGIRRACGADRGPHAERNRHGHARTPGRAER
jgi:hypothetical protein